jgi:DNA-binding beta-propeller fold protein YncE
VTDLHDLKQDIDSMRFATPPLHEIVDRARRSQRRRLRRRIFTTAVLVAVVVFCSIVIVSRPGARGPELNGPGSQRYRGTATAAFVSRSGLVYVADQGNDSLLVLDPSSRPGFEPVATIPLSFTPGVVAVSPNGTTAYVSPLVPEVAGGSNTLYEVDLSTQKVVRTIVDRSQPLGSIAIAPDGKTAYAWGDDIVPIDLSTGQILKPISRSQSDYTDLEISPNGRTAIATSEGVSPNYQLINLVTGNITRTVSIGDLQIGHTKGMWSPQTVAFSPDGTSAYIGVQQEAGSSSAWLLKVSVRTGRVESGVELGQGGIGDVVVTSDGSRVFVLVQTDVKGVYSGAFTIAPVKTGTLTPLPRMVVGDVQGLGLLQFGTADTLYAVDTQWRLARIDERTDQIISTLRIPVPSLLATTLQPISFRG